MKSSILGMLPWTRNQIPNNQSGKHDTLNHKSLGTKSGETDKMKETTISFANHCQHSQNRKSKMPPLLRLDSEGEISTGNNFCDKAVNNQLKKLNLNNRFSASFDLTNSTTDSEHSVSRARRLSLNKSIPPHQSFKKSMSDPSGLIAHQSFPPPSSSLSAIRKTPCSVADALSPYSSGPRLLGSVNIFKMNSQEGMNIVPSSPTISSSSPCANVFFMKDQMDGQHKSGLCENVNGFKLDVHRGDSPHSGSPESQNTSEMNSGGNCSDSSKTSSQSFNSNDSSSVLFIHKKKRRRSRSKRKKQKRDVEAAIFRPSSCSSPLKGESSIDSTNDSRLQESSSTKACTSGVLNVKIVSPIHHILLKSKKNEHHPSSSDSLSSNQSPLNSSRMSSNSNFKCIDEDQFSDDDLVFDDSSSVVFFEESPLSKPKSSSKKQKLQESEESNESDDEQMPVSGLRFTLSLTLSEAEEDENDSSVDWDTSASPLEGSQFFFECEFNTGLSLDTILRPSPSECPETKAANKRMRDLNAKWNAFYSSDKGISLQHVNQRKIHFADDNNLATIHIVGDEDRAGDWQRFALERERFKRRIDEVEQILAPILCENHRGKVFNRMFDN